MESLPLSGFYHGFHGTGLGNLPPDPPKICAICGDKALSCNFGCVTCESCKAFFRRNAHRDNVKGRCDGRCTITVDTRSYCKSCRLEKCFRMGMKKELILSDEQRAERKRKIQANREKKAKNDANSGTAPSEHEPKGTTSKPTTKPKTDTTKRRPPTSPPSEPPVPDWFHAPANMVSKDLLESFKTQPEKRLEEESESGGKRQRKPIEDIIDGKSGALHGEMVDQDKGSRFMQHRSVTPKFRPNLGTQSSLLQTSPSSESLITFSASGNTSTKSNAPITQSTGAKVTLCDILSTSSDTDEPGGSALQDEGFASCSDVASNSPDSFVFSSNPTLSFEDSNSDGTELIPKVEQPNPGNISNTMPQNPVETNTQAAHTTGDFSEPSMRVQGVAISHPGQLSAIARRDTPVDGSTSNPLQHHSPGDLLQNASAIKGLLPLLLGGVTQQNGQPVDIQSILPLLLQNSDISQEFQGTQLSGLPPLTQGSIHALHGVLQTFVSGGLPKEALINAIAQAMSVNLQQSMPQISTNDITVEADVSHRSNELPDRPIESQMVDDSASSHMRQPNANPITTGSRIVNTLLGDGAAPVATDNTSVAKAAKTNDNTSRDKQHSNAVATAATKPYQRVKDVVLKHPPIPCSTAYAFEYISCVSKDVADLMDPEARMLISELTEAFSHAFDMYVEESFSGEPSYVECFNYCEFYVKCVVRMVSKMNAFTSFCTDDQINILKNSIVEIFILHSVRAFDVLEEGFYIRQKQGFQFLSIEALRTLPQGSDLVKGYTHFALEVLRKTKNDGGILMCLVVMCLFRIRKEDKVQYKDVARVERCYGLYMWTLCNYMNVKYPDRGVTIDWTKELCELIEKLCVDFVKALCQCTVDDLSPLLSEMLEISDIKK